MKKKWLPAAGIFALALFNCGNHHNAEEASQNNTYTVTMEGIDSLKLMMTVPEVEALLQAKLPLKYIGNGGYGDTVAVKYKTIDMLLYLDGDKKENATLRCIQTSSNICKTASGLGTGSAKMSVINAYPDNLKYVAPEYEAYPIRSKTKSAIAVMDTLENRAIVFHIINRKVVSLDVQYYYEFY